MNDLHTLEGVQAFLASSTPHELAVQLQKDCDVCRSEPGTAPTIPSLLAHVLPARDDAVAAALSALRFTATPSEQGVPLADSERRSTNYIPLPIARMLYSETLTSIKSHLANLTRPEPPSTSSSPNKGPNSDGKVPEHLIPSDDEYRAALKVLRYLQLPSINLLPAGPRTPLDKITQIIHARLEQSPTHNSTIHAASPSGTSGKRASKSKVCYICRYTLRRPLHPLYPSLCAPCADFNLTSSSLSLPASLDLSGKTALVTGARVNLGFHTALRLLRCGARVIASSRYPYDALQSYRGQSDWNVWKGRLRIVGADFRTARDVFGLVEAVKRIVTKGEWGEGDGLRFESEESKGEGILHILINNAAQTLTDSVQKEEESVRRESTLMLEVGDQGKTIITEGGAYNARVRGGSQLGYIGPGSEGPLLIEAGASQQLTTSAPNPIKSSWTQKISEIPYEDVISAHSVNTFVPFILIRELLPLMSPKRPSPPSPSTVIRSAGHIVNVSSREGLFERTPFAGSKAGMHVHTNMSKAALNMLTETEAAAAWKKYKVAMNNVDPGYMSADPEYMEYLGRTGEPCPIGWEDGAGRVLWPIAKGEKGEGCYGRFLKHFKEVEVGR